MNLGLITMYLPGFNINTVSKDESSAFETWQAVVKCLLTSCFHTRMARSRYKINENGRLTFVFPFYKQ